VDLRGFDPSGTPVRPEAAVRGFLDALGVPAERIPADPGAQAALYRSLLAGKRMLVLLDNARDAAQVRSLLPGTRGNLVVVTSRSQLTSLAVTAGATQISLDVLTGAEALELLASWLGPARVAGEREAAAEITELCARLPLALAIMAARAVARPGLPLGALAAELRQARERLDVLATGDTATDVRAVFSWSYQNLGDHAARMFRLTGLHPGPSISAPVAASLVALPLAEARAALRELAAAHLLTEHVPGRYAFHDLLRAYAAEQASTTDSDSGRQAAMHRMLDHYLHTSHAATMLISLSRVPLTLDKAQPGVSPEELVDRQEATTWFEAERRVLLGVTTAAASAGFDTHAWQIPWAFAAFLQFRGHWGEYAATQRAAQAAAQRLGDLSGQAGAHYHLGLAVGMTGSYDEARDHLSQSLVLRQQLGDLVGQARSHEALGWIGERQGRHKDALEHAHLALELHRRAGHQAGQSAALNAIGWFHARLGDYEQALASCQDALALGRESGDRGIQASALDSIGFAQHHLGHHIQAVASYQQALHLYREHGHRHGTSTVLRHLGDTYYATRDFDRARDIWRQALDILDELHHADADEVRAKLGKLGGPLPGDG
jgi:tetratricopeptide (TPR) repeat protein